MPDHNPPDRLEAAKLTEAVVKGQLIADMIRLKNAEAALLAQRERNKAQARELLWPSLVVFLLVFGVPIAIVLVGALINLGVERIFAARLICGLVFVGFWYAVYRAAKSAGRLTMNRRRTASSICPRCGNAEPRNVSTAAFRCTGCGWEERR